MARLPYVSPESASPETWSILERLPGQLNIFKMMAHAETCFRPLLRLGSAILAEQQLDGKLRELSILRIATLSHAQYEWVQHEPIAKAAGATQAQIDALARGATDSGPFDAVERLVLRFTTEVVEHTKASDETFKQMRDHFSPREIVELLISIGFYMTIARLAETTAVEVDLAPGTAIVDSAKQGAPR